MITDVGYPIPLYINYLPLMPLCTPLFNQPQSPHSGFQSLNHLYRHDIYPHSRLLMYLILYVFLPSQRSVLCLNIKVMVIDMRHHPF